MKVFIVQYFNGSDNLVVTLRVEVDNRLSTVSTHGKTMKLLGERQPASKGYIIPDGSGGMSELCSGFGQLIND